MGRNAYYIYLGFVNKVVVTRDITYTHVFAVITYIIIYIIVLYGRRHNYVYIVK